MESTKNCLNKVNTITYSQHTVRGPIIDVDIVEV